MKKICVTSVVSLLIAFVLVFAGCEQPVTGQDNTSGEVTAGEGAVQKEMGSPDYFKFTRELKSAKI